MLLTGPQTALDDIDDEIVGFTQNGGWQKLNNLLLQVMRSGMQEYSCDDCPDRVDAVQILFDELKVSLSVLHRDGF